MYRSHCGVCCEKTGMMLSNADVERLDRMGYDREKFARYDRHGFVRLRNHHERWAYLDHSVNRV
jgi:hypothetical protein